MKGWAVGLFAFALMMVALVSTASALTPNCFDKINNDPSSGHSGIDCADRWTAYGDANNIGAETCPVTLHPKLGPNGQYCWNGLMPVCSPGQNEYDGNYYAGWVCPDGPAYETYVPNGEYGSDTYDEYNEYNEYNDYYYDSGYDDYYYEDSYYYDDYSYTFCGDGICSYGEHCFSDCEYGQGNDFNYYYDYGYYDGGYAGFDYCYVDAPYVAYEGDTTPIRVVFYGSAPYSAEVDCGDGSTATAYRNGVYSYDGAMYAYCHYNYQGIFYPRAYVGGSVCYGDSVEVRGASPNYYYDDDYYDDYDDDGDYYPYPSPKPTVTATPTPEPKNPGCALTAMPGAIQEGGSSVVSVSYYDLSAVPNSISINCGNGATKNAVNCYGKTGSCSVFCNYPDEGEYDAIASASGIACSPTTIEVGAATAEKCSDGTSFGTCSINQPKYCDEGLLVDRASICGCPEDMVRSGERCKEPAGSCSLILNPSTVRANGQSTAVITFDGITSPIAQVLCGNGETQTASCISSGNLKGTCTATCAYGEENSYPVTYQVRGIVSGVTCGSANVRVTAPLEDAGTLLAKVSECESGEALEQARVRIEGENDYYTDRNGQLKVQLEPATYNLQVSKSNYLQATQTVVVQRGKISTADVCLQSEGCDIDAILVRTPQTDDARSPLLFQIKVTNNLNMDNTVQIEYSSAYNIDGPQTITLGAHASQTISVYVTTSGSRTGRSYGTVSITGTSDCAKNIDLPINVVGGLSIELEQPYKESFGGKKVCYDLLVRNRGENEGTVTLTYTGDFDAEFSPAQFYLNAQEIKDGVEFCVSVPSGESGTHTFALRALSGISDALSFATLKVLESGDFETDIDDSCIFIEDGRMYPISISNDVADGDYSVSLRENGVNARVTPSMLYNFKRGTSRTVYISADERNFDSGSTEYVQLLLKRDGEIALQRDVCLTTDRYYYDDYYYDGHYYYYDGGHYYNPPSTSVSGIYTQLSQNSLNLAKEASGSTILSVKNTGGRGDYFYIRVDAPLQVSISDSAFYLAPDEEKKVTIRVTAGAEAKRYSIPIKIFQGSGSGGVNYQGSIGSSTAFIRCGDGRTVGLECDEGTSSCAANCRYTDVGSFTLEANVGNLQCEENEIRVIGDGSRGCAVSVESYVPGDTRTTIRVRYYNLPNEPSNEEIQVYCGNGNTVTATDCDGTSGTCTASCYYSGTSTVTVGASASGISCTSREIKVGKENSYCSISSPGLVREGDVATVSLKYRNARFGGQFYPYSYRTDDGYYESGRLMKTETLQVIVAGGGSTATIPASDLKPDAIEFKRVVAGDLPSTGKGNVAVTLKNLRDYKLDEIVLLAEELPAGVSLVQVEPFEISSNGERTIYFQLQSENAREGKYEPKLKIRFDSQSLEKAFELRIVPESESLNAEVTISNIIYESGDGGGRARIDFSVRNLERSPMQISALFREIPSEWGFRVEPPLGMIAPGDVGNFSANISAKGVESKSYSAVIELRSVDGRTLSVPVVLEFNKLNPLSGLFSFASGLGALQIIIILLIVAVAAIAYASMKSGAKEGDEDERNDRLRGIGDEISGSEKQTTLLDEKKFTKGPLKRHKYEKVRWAEEPDDYESTYIEMDEDSKEDRLSFQKKEDEEE